MILRALFFIMVVGVLAPREPDLGLGRPAMRVDVPGVIGLASKACNDGDCTMLPGTFDAIKAQITGNLARVKADIAEAQQQRALHGN